VTVRLPPELRTMPLEPTPELLSVSPRNAIASLGPALMSMASPPGAGTIPASTPSGLVMVTALVMLIGPNPALSIAVTSPPVLSPHTATTATRVRSARRARPFSKPSLLWTHAMAPPGAIGC
jgi:hypothetical protein